MLTSRGLAATMTLNVLSSLAGGTPLSVTRTLMLLVIEAYFKDGVQVNTPLVALIVAPVGGLGSKLNVSAFAGTSGSVAEFVNVNVAPSTMVQSAIGASTGAWFTARRNKSLKSVALAASPSRG